jgi:hypothetical protein
VNPNGRTPKLVTFYGRRVTLRELARETGLSLCTIQRHSMAADDVTELVEANRQG